MVKKSEKNKGITLIALVVTIVVLIILAGISISMLTGENGIITQAQKAKEETEIGKEKEMVSLAVSSLKGQGYVTGENFLTSENLQKEMDEIAGKDKTLVTGTTILTVLFRESNREYYINSKGEFVEPIDYSTIYTYTEDGYITGLKDEYLGGGTTGSSIKYASLNNLRLSFDYSRYMAEELNGTLEIPNKINNTKIIGIESDAFIKIRNLKKVIMQNGIIVIRGFAFSDCDILEEVTLPETIEEIGRRAFSFSNLSNITIPFSVEYIASEAFYGCNNLTSIIVEKQEGSLPDEPWGAEYATVEYIGNRKLLEFANNYLSDKSEQELEEIILKDEMYIGTFEEWLIEQGKTRDDLKQEASNNGVTYLEYLKSRIIQNELWIVLEYQASSLGILDKKPEELEPIFVDKAKEEGLEEQIGEFNTFDELLEKTNMTRQEFEEMYESQGFRTEEDFLKYMIITYYNIF